MGSSLLVLLKAMKDSSSRQPESGPSQGTIRQPPPYTSSAHQQDTVPVRAGLDPFPAYAKNKFKKIEGNQVTFSLTFLCPATWKWIPNLFMFYRKKSFFTREIERGFLFIKRTHFRISL